LLVDFFLIFVVLTAQEETITVIFKIESWIHLCTTLAVF